jgi:hypothetical protein
MLHLFVGEIEILFMLKARKLSSNVQFKICETNRMEELKQKNC